MRSEGLEGERELKLTPTSGRAKSFFYEIHLTHALALSLQKIAQETNTSSDELTQRTMEAVVSEYKEIRGAVRESDEQFERGEFLSHEEVVARLAQRFEKA